MYRKADDLALYVQQPLNEIRHVEALFWGNILMNHRFEQVDPGVHQKIYRRFFCELAHYRTITLNDTVRDLNAVLPHSDGQICGVLAMKSEHGAEIHAGQNVAIDDQHCVFRTL